MRFYVKSESVDLGKKLITIRDKDEIHHIRHVMRLGKGMDIALFDGRGNEFEGQIKQDDSNSIEINIKSSYKSKREAPHKVTLYQAIPKKTNLDLIVEKATELGVSRITPIVTERCEVRNIFKNKLERLKRIAMAASKQCNRSTLPIISDAIDFKKEFENVSKKADITLIPISAARFNEIEAKAILEKQGLFCNIAHVMWLKPFKKDHILKALNNSKAGLVIDAGFEICGASQGIAYELMLLTGKPVKALGLEDRSVGVSFESRNETPGVDKIVKTVKDILC